MFWIGILYFAEGFPLGVFYEIFPVYFRQHGVELRSIGALSLLGLAWTLKFIWAPAIDHYRHHRIWMAWVDVLMGVVMLAFAIYAELGVWAWFAIGAFTLLSATNDIAIDGYTIEFLEKNELGLANGLRIAFYRVGMLASGFLLVLSDYLSWRGAFLFAALAFCVCAALSLAAPREKPTVRTSALGLGPEIKAIAAQPRACAAAMLLVAAALWLIERETKWSLGNPYFWLYTGTMLALPVGLSFVIRARNINAARADTNLNAGPMFGALMEMLQRPHIFPVIAFVLIFKLADSAMGFMVKPFWVDSGFTATEIGLVSVNIGLVLSIAGGIAGGWFTDRVGIFKALWILGLFQAFSNLGYAWAAAVIPPAAPDVALLAGYRVLLYGVSAVESFTGGLGTAAFLAFLMAIVDKKHSATEYALLSSVFALSRSVAGWASGAGAQEFGYAPYFAFTFFLAFPAYLLLPWVKIMLAYSNAKTSA
ncbi:MAG: MFS transporter [Burkholderiales bacterium]